MLEVHPTYNKARIRKLRSMFTGDAAQGSETFYIREHFDTKRVCESCGRRTSAAHFSVASIVIEGDSWVLPVSVTEGGQIVLDLRDVIPDQSNFYNERIIEALPQLGITFDPAGEVKYALELRNPIESARRAAVMALPEDLQCGVVEPTPKEVLLWDVQLHHAWAQNVYNKGGGHVSAYNVQAEYIHWLAVRKKLIAARLGYGSGQTVAVAYATPGPVGFTMLDVKIGGTEALRNEFEDVLILHLFMELRAKAAHLHFGSFPLIREGSWPLTPIGSPAFRFSNRIAWQSFVDGFGTC